MGNQLAQRVSEQRGGKPNGNGNGNGEVEKVKSLADQIRKMQPEYQAAMPKGMEATQLVRDAITCLRTVRDLDKCEPMSVLGALMTTAQLGLRPAVLGHAWPLPFWDGRTQGYKAQLVIGYQGYVELGYRSGKLAGVTSRIVYKNDEYDVIYHADRDEVIHKPNKDEPRTEIRCFYSAGRLTNGGYSVTDPMSLRGMEIFRDENAPRNRAKEITGPWVNHFAAMGQKTMVRINFKLLPKSPEMAIAMEADDGVRINLEPNADAAEVTEHPIVAGHVEHDEPPAAADPLDADDAWAVKIEDISSREEAAAVRAEVGERVKDKSIDGSRANRILATLDAKVATLPGGAG